MVEMGAKFQAKLRQKRAMGIAIILLGFLLSMFSIILDIFIGEGFKLNQVQLILILGGLVVAAFGAVYIAAGNAAVLSEMSLQVTRFENQIEEQRKLISEQQSKLTVLGDVATDNLAQTKDRAAMKIGGDVAKAKPKEETKKEAPKKEEKKPEPKKEEELATTKHILAFEGIIEEEEEEEKEEPKEKKEAPKPSPPPVPSLPSQPQPPPSRPKPPPSAPMVPTPTSVPTPSPQPVTTVPRPLIEEEEEEEEEEGEEDIDITDGLGIMDFKPTKVESEEGGREESVDVDAILEEIHTTSEEDKSVEVPEDFKPKFKLGAHPAPSPPPATGPRPIPPPPPSLQPSTGPRTGIGPPQPPRPYASPPLKPSVVPPVPTGVTPQAKPAAKEGSLVPCPGCGEPIESEWVKCPLCGFQVRR